MVKPLLKERRSSLRARRVLSIEYRLCKSKRSHVDRSWRLSTTQEISTAGISFYSDCEYYADDVLEIHVIMSGILDVFKGFGRVVRSQRKQTGSSYFVAVKLMKNRPRAHVKAPRRGLVKPKDSLRRRI